MRLSFLFLPRCCRRISSLVSLGWYTGRRDSRTLLDLNRRVNRGLLNRTLLLLNLRPRRMVLSRMLSPRLSSHHPADRLDKVLHDSGLVRTTDLDLARPAKDTDLQGRKSRGRFLLLLERR